MTEHASLETALCLCGCNQYVTKLQNKFISGHNSRVRHPTQYDKYNQTILRSKLKRIYERMITKLDYCKCGCGERVRKKGNRFILGHNSRLHKKIVIEKNCLNCGKPFEVPLWYSKKGGGKFCSSKCYGFYMRGKLHPNASKSLKKRYKTGLEPWNKNLTKETDDRVATGIEKMKYTKQRFFAWSNFWKLVEKLDSEPKSVKIRRTLKRKHKAGECLIWNKGKTKEEYPQLSNSGMRSEKFTEETREKLRRARLKQKLPTKDSKIELIMQNALTEIGIKYKKHIPLLGRYKVDILIGTLIVECDGDYWHNYPNGLKKDKIRDSNLLSAGFIVLRFWEHQINNNIEECIDTITGELERLEAKQCL